MAGFGVVAGVFALFFFSDVPKVRKDIMQVSASLSTYTLFPSTYALKRYKIGTNHSHRTSPSSAISSLGKSRHQTT